MFKFTIVVKKTLFIEKSRRFEWKGFIFGA